MGAKYKKGCPFGQPFLFNDGLSNLSIICMGDIIMTL